MSIQDPITSGKRSVQELKDELSALDAAIRILQRERDNTWRTMCDAAYTAHQQNKAPCLLSMEVQ